jgi:hypothetical protein
LRFPRNSAACRGKIRNEIGDGHLFQRTFDASIKISQVKKAAA